jgi:hypothetical protein
MATDRKRQGSLVDRMSVTSTLLYGAAQVSKALGAAWFFANPLVAQIGSATYAALILTIVLYSHSERQMLASRLANRRLTFELLSASFVIASVQASGDLKAFFVLQCALWGLIATLPKIVDELNKTRLNRTQSLTGHLTISKSTDGRVARPKPQTNELDV